MCIRDSRQSGGNAECPLDLRHVGSVLHVDAVPVLDEMLDPALAAAAAWILVDGDGWLLRCRIGRRCPDGGGGERERDERHSESHGPDGMSFHVGIDLSVRSICFLCRPSCWPTKMSH